MHASRWFVSGSIALVLGCPGGGDGGSDATTVSGTTTTDPTTVTDPTTTTAPAESSTGVAESSSSSSEASGPADTSTGEACPAEAECMDDSMCPGGGMCVGCICLGGNQCDPIVQGEWNSCVGANGNTDNTLCNWVGTGEATGFIGCLNSASMDGANVCFISGCRDACDCFAPPPTGTATVTCGMILADNGTGCALDCSDGKICPDGMICSDNICFWPPA